MEHRFGKLLRAGGALLLAAVAHVCWAGGISEWYDHARDEVVDTYQQGGTDVLLPFRTYHLRSAYSDAQIHTFQEHPPGLGLGRSRLDEKGNWHGVYALEFQDSHYMPEWMIGYSWLYGMRVVDDARASLGYAAFITTRKDYSNYAPTPGIVPIASLQIHRLSVEGTYIPGGRSFGNILFFWFKWHMGE